MRFRVRDDEDSDGNRVALDAESDLVSAEVRSDALNAVNKYVDQHDGAAIDDAAGETIGEGWVDGESWEVTLRGDALGEDGDVELSSATY